MKTDALGVSSDGVMSADLLRTGSRSYKARKKRLRGREFCAEKVRRPSTDFHFALSVGGTLGRVVLDEHYVFSGQILNFFN